MSDCGCKVVPFTHKIVYCPLHAAAPILLDACKAALDLRIGLDDTAEMLRLAVKAAEAK